jgi:hypothetical protein
MRCRHLDVFDFAAAIALLVLDADVGEFHVSVPVRQVTFPSPLLDFLGLPLGPTRSVTAATIGRLQEALVLALELLFEDDPTDACSTRKQPVSGLNVCAIQPDVMRQLARLGDAGIESLAGIFTLVPSRVFQNRTASIGQRHERRPSSTDDVWRCLKKSELAQVIQIPGLGFSVPILVAQVGPGHGPKGADRGECPHFRATEVVLLIPQPDALAGRTARQIEVPNERLPRVVARRRFLRLGACSTPPTRRWTIVIEISWIQITRHS